MHQHRRAPWARGVGADTAVPQLVDPVFPRDRQQGTASAARQRDSLSSVGFGTSIDRYTRRPAAVDGMGGTRLRYEGVGRRRVSSTSHADRRSLRVTRCRRYFFDGRAPGPAAAGRALPSAQHYYDVFHDRDGDEGTEISLHKERLTLTWANKETEQLRAELASAVG